mmetsp:Transcript_93603/g.166538  ORF Transcript_93603/g.166538 Transcript_93603/m.166538 type:complete len:187 (-) Transcript_93603:21-581(-)|eukprot:CAMPEP_0197686006 /NCGR_PEP_ID=MMETSP1338-20131121/101850_1 /TAXON_ID=43686 ORGANISM="Pelagodinium beii, Strain RCC1491" /NCGR_SAMPLE_ID=MMETSP1338 /ASSEMBLY_ACC=CAM_ASM_000754 /LENGTH=186 /DNA_ID=CAMNT_0043267897 /DNA_START=47 /DNA_END=607 /DNA_ORIENTATION=-
MGSLLSFFFPRRLPAPEQVAQSQRTSSSQDSALRQNIETKGENAYYYAHSRKFEVPADAKVISGPGLVTGGPPVKLEAEAAILASERRTEAIRNFSWADDGAKVKVYLQLPDGVLRDPSQVTCDFEPRSFHAQVAPQKQGATYSCKVEPLKADIVPEKSSIRASVDKGKVTVTLQKKTDSPWHELK